MRCISIVRSLYFIIFSASFLINYYYYYYYYYYSRSVTHEKPPLPFGMYVCPHVSARLPLDNFYLKFGIGVFYENMSKNLNFVTKLDKI
jgi:hypothetical protein